jgi:hypothetical protein
MDINLSVVMDALRTMALAAAADKPQGDMPAFNASFLRGIQTFGRSYDLGTIVAYKLRSRRLMRDMDKFPAMLTKGKLAILPPSGANRKAVRRIFDNDRRGKGSAR